MMTYRKTWFSRVLWILYTIFCVILLAACGINLAYYFAGIPYLEGFPDSVAAPLAGLEENALLALGLFAIPISAALYWMIRGIAGRVRKRCLWKESVITGFECAIVLLVMAGGLFLRIVSAGFDIQMLDNPLFVDAHVRGMAYYDLAVVTAKSTAASSYYGIGRLYVLCLSAALSFLGNKVASAIILQVILQMVGMMLAYGATRKTAGRIPACAAILYLACSPCCLETLTWFTPEWLFFDLYMIGMLIVASFVKGYCANRFSVAGSAAGAVFSGAVTGLLAYLDPAAVTLLIFVAAVATGTKLRQDGIKARNCGKVSALVMFLTLLAAFACWFGVSAAVYYGEESNLPDAVLASVADIRYAVATPFSQAYPYVLDIYLLGFLVIPASFLVLEFFRSGREQNYTLWLLLCILAAPTPMSSIGMRSFGLFALYIWSVLAGLGVQNCIFGGQGKMEQDMMEEIREVEEVEETGSTADEMEDGGAAETVMTETGEAWEKLYVDEGAETLETVEKSKEVEEPQEPARPRYFENPLPLPKKHVKREMDYHYQVDEKDMKYDIEISEDDDFDIP